MSKHAQSNQQQLLFIIFILRYFQVKYFHKLLCELHHVYFLISCGEAADDVFPL